MKLHIGADKRGIVHTVTATNAAAADITQLPRCCTGRSAKCSATRRTGRKPIGRPMRRAGCATGSIGAPTPGRSCPRAQNQLRRSRTRARGEHPFRVVKHLWGFVKVRYRGLVKNLARAHAMFALANLYQVRRQLLPSAANCAL